MRERYESHDTHQFYRRTLISTKFLYQNIATYLSPILLDMDPQISSLKPFNASSSTPNQPRYGRNTVQNSGRIPGSNTPKKISSSATEALSKVNSMVRKSNVIVILSVITLLVIIAVILYVIYRVRRSDLDSVHIIKKPRKLYYPGRSKPFQFASDKMPVSKHGMEYTYSFWLYINNFEITTTHKVIFMRGFNGKNFASASPIIYMDARTNKLYMSVRSNQSVTLTPLQHIPNGRASRFMTGVVEYVPLQRWVHLAMVVKDNLLTVFMDGEMYTVENVLDLSTNTNGTRPIFTPSAGDVMVGSMPGSSNLQGYITQLTFYNHALSLHDIKYDVYSKGPFNVSQSIMGKLGVGDYRLRTPVYKETGDSSMDEDSMDEDKD